LMQDALRPWRYQNWIFPRDERFLDRAGQILDLYACRWHGQPLWSDEYVLSADEKTSIQARRRLHPTTPPRSRQLSRVEHEYERLGAWAYLAAWDVHHARLFGRCERTTGIRPFGRLVRDVMKQPPYCEAERVFWIVDNGSSHRGERSFRRMRRRYRRHPELVLVHLPVHASCLNQMEIYFSIVQRKVLTPNDFNDLHKVPERLLAFQHRYEAFAPAIPLGVHTSRPCHTAQELDSDAVHAPASCAA
jgi:hypothetical protein